VSSHPVSLMLMAFSMDSRKVNLGSRDHFRASLKMFFRMDFCKQGRNWKDRFRAFHGEGLEIEYCHQNPVTNYVLLMAMATKK